MNRRRIMAKGGVLAAAAIIGGVVVLVSRVGDSRALSVVTVGRSPLALALDTRTRHVFVVNNDGSPTGTVSMLDAATGALLKTIPVGQFPTRIVVDEGSAHAFVLNSAAPWMAVKASVSIVDTRSGQEVRRLSFTTAPFLLDNDPSTGHFFVAMGLNGGSPTAPPAGRLQTRATTSGRLVRTVSLPSVPVMSAVDGRRGRLFLIGTRSLNGVGQGWLAMLDTQTGRLLTTTALAMTPEAVGVETRQGHVFVAGVQGARGACSTAGGVCKTFGAIVTIDPHSGRTLRTVGIGQYPNALVVDQNTRRAFVVTTGNDQSEKGTVDILDTQTGSLLRTTTVGYLPVGAALSLTHAHVYITDGNGGTVSVLDAGDGGLQGAFHVADGPQAVAVDEKTDRVFVTSSDLSNDSIPSHRTDPSIFDKIGAFGTTLERQARTLATGKKGVVSMFDTRVLP